MLNQLNCIVQGGNTGFGDCTLDIKNIVGLFLVPPGTEIEAADLEDLGAYLATKVSADDKSERFYPVHSFVGITDNSEEANIGSLGYGGKNFIREGDYDWTLRFQKGGMCLLKSLQMFNQSDKDVFFYDVAGVLYGTESNGKLRSVPLELLHVPKFQINDGSESSIYGIRISFRSNFVNELLGFVDTAAQNLILSTFKGLKNMPLVAVDPENSPIVNIRAITGCDRKNLYDTFETELAVPGLWKAYTADGTVLSITTVVANPTLKAFTVTVDGASPFYVELVGPTALTAGDVPGYESKRVLIP